MEEIRVVTLYDEENDTQTDFELVDTIESDGKTYWLVAELPEEDDEDEDEDEENIGAWLFAVCDRSEAEVSATLDGLEVCYEYVERRGIQAGLPALYAVGGVRFGN